MFLLTQLIYLNFRKYFVSSCCSAKIVLMHKMSKISVHEMHNKIYWYKNVKEVTANKEQKLGLLPILSRISQAKLKCSSLIRGRKTQTGEISKWRQRH